MENPDAGFKPSFGSLQELYFRSSYSSVSTAGGLHEFADSQSGHVFANGEDRSESRKNMTVALKELRIHGDFRTTVEQIPKAGFIKSCRDLHRWKPSKSHLSSG